MEEFVQILYIVSSALLIPVIVCLLLFSAWALMEIGGIISEYIDRKKHSKRWKNTYSKIMHDSKIVQSQFFGNMDFPGFLGKFSLLGARVSGQNSLIAKLSSDMEIEIAAVLSKMSLGIRLGPMFGLMGTLIPLGPALIGLSTGDIQEMAQNLVVAFSTTVLGLAIGAVFYIISQIRRKWYSADMNNIEFITDLIIENEEEKVGSHNDAKFETLSQKAI